VEGGKAYAIYLKEGSQGNLTLEIPPGRYRAEWLNPRTGDIERRADVEHPGGNRTLASPVYSKDEALRLVRSEG
jgi:collagenase-like protein with putative collagen-binding domain